MQFIKTLICLAFILVVNVSTFSAPGMATAAMQGNLEQDPVVLLQNLSNELIKCLDENKSTLKSDPSIITEIVHTIVMPHVDKETMIKIVLGRSGYQDWKKATEQTRNDFEAAFTNLIIGTYVSALQSFENERVTVYPPRKPITTETRVRLSAKIFNNNNPPVAMTYVLKLEEGEWKIIDFSVEGISLIQSYQSQFQEILSNGEGLQHLVKTLQEHNASI